MLYGSGETVFPAGDIRQQTKCFEVDLHVCNRPVGKHYAAVRSSGLNADLRQAFEPWRAFRESCVEAVHIRVQLFNSAVLRAHLTDLSLIHISVPTSRTPIS